MNKGNQPSGDGQKLAEFVEQRGLAEGNTRRAPTAETQCSGKVSRGLLSVREAARRDKRLQFTALLHHIDVSLLLESYQKLKRGAAPGVDGVRWKDYQERVLERLTDLHDRIHKGSYRALPSKRARIAKEDGSERKLGIAALEDKIVQQARSKIVTALTLALAAAPALAQPEQVPEPGLVPLLAVGAAVGIFLHWRNKRKK